ncbi:MAG: lipase chaperone [Spirochaetia bacterium]|nr:lipase chaperone [Spirochaetia bacterium]
MDKKWIFGGIAALVIIIVTVLFLSSSRSKNGQSSLLPDAQFENWSILGGNSAEGFDLFDEEGMLSYDELIAQAKKGRISLVSELWRMRRNCPKDMDFHACNEKLRAFIGKKFPYPDNEKLIALFDKYIRYEQTMMETKFGDNLTNQQRYAAIKQKRRELFGEEDAQLVFGLEESKAGFAFALQDFAKSTAGQSGDARIASYEAMRRKNFGNYYDAVVAAEPAYNKFETEVMLRDADLSKASDEQKSAMTQAMREKYFGPEGAKRMADLDKQLGQEREKETQLQAAEKKFLADNASMSEADKTAKLLELRKKYLGDDEAEAYTRRMEYEKYMQSQNK